MKRVFQRDLKERGKNKNKARNDFLISYAVSYFLVGDRNGRNFIVGGITVGDRNGVNNFGQCQKKQKQFRQCFLVTTNLFVLLQKNILKQKRTNRS